MRVTLVQLPVVRHDVGNLAPPLGLLCVAAALERRGIEVAVRDFNVRGVLHPSSIDAGFYRHAAGAIQDTAPDLVGFTSMGVESHVGLELARRLKAEDPHLRTVLGGPHFSAIAREVLTLFPWIDHVILGEGERPACELVEALRHGRSPHAISNVASRDGHGVILNRELKPHRDLDVLPFPAYHLVDLNDYFTANPSRVLHFEHGRGCALRCAFCYSLGHWGQGEQVKRIDHVVKLAHRHRELGAHHLFFVGDNLVNNMRWATALGHALRDADLGLTWNAYATSAQLTPEVLQSLGSSGCVGLFIGIDAVTDSLQKRVKKRYYRGWDSLHALIERCKGNGIRPTLSMLVGDDTASPHDAEMTFRTALEASSLGCGIRMNTLSIYNGTAIDHDLRARELEYCEIKPRLLFDSFPLNHRNELAQAHPRLFPFHSALAPRADFESMAASSFIAVSLLRGFKRTLCAWVKSGQDCWDLVQRVRAESGDLCGLPAQRRRDHVRETFIEHFEGRQKAPDVCAAFEQDRAEYLLRDGEPTLIEVDGGGRSGTFRLSRMTLASAPLPAPCGGKDDEPEAQNDPVIARLYFRHEGATRILPVSCRGVELVSRLVLARHDGSVSLSRAEVDGLCDIGLLAPAS